MTIARLASNVIKACYAHCISAHRQSLEVVRQADHSGLTIATLASDESCMPIAVAMSARCGLTIANMASDMIKYAIDLTCSDDLPMSQRNLGSSMSLGDCSESLQRPMPNYKHSAARDCMSHHIS